MIGFAIVALCLVPVGHAAANDAGIQMGYYFDHEALSLGVGMLASMSSNYPAWYFNPNAELIVGDGPNMAALNFDFHYDFATDGDLTFWAGAGPGLYFVDRRFDDDLEPGLNLLGGFGARTGNVRPYFQGKAVVMDNSEISLAVGLRF
jgi:hypothetical protein